jgi:hypothetical protein
VKRLEQLIDEQLRLPPVLPEAKAVLGAIPGVVGVGLGLRTRAGRLTDDIVLSVTVWRKRSPAAIPAGERIPPVFGGIPTDVTVAVGARSIQLDLEDVAAEKGSRKVDTLVGGVPITDRKRDWTRGTLGCFAEPASGPAAKLLLTNQHVIYARRSDTGPGDLIGQPDITCSWCCKTGVIGRAEKGANDEFVDCGIAKLNDKRPFVQKLPGVGKDVNGRNEDLVVGVAQPVSVAGMLTAVFVKDPVRKLGLVTGPTHGVVHKIHDDIQIDVGTPSQRTMKDQIIVRPEKGGDVLGDGSVNFAIGGDSGAVLINRFNQVVGLVHKAVDFTGQPGNQPPWKFWAAACHIHRVTAQLGIKILVSPGADTSATPAVPTPAFPPPGPPPPPPTPTGALVPGMGLTLHRLTDEERTRGSVLDQVVAALESSRAGARVLELYDAHHGEIHHLVNHDRRVKILWHRSHGPAFVARLLGGMRDLGQPIPREVEGLPIEELIRRMAEAFRERGSPGLVATVNDYLAPVLELLERSRTLDELLARVRAWGGGR